MYSQNALDNPDLVEFKRVMESAILRSGKSKKVVAIEMNVPAPVLSHWLSEHTVFSMPGHLIPLFETVVGNRMLSDLVCGKAEQGRELA